ncbi:hypothetical protein IHE45_04G082800 [Dioscorea alata]|uniref:Uncharacterized protein n=1 Tax=Dioscorea alata TaxID=55571 RepID=A0ACB7WDB9_DIOAL|nr:hypothetical protein IHE45_04G082800 [Dioscorea alata]
MENSFFMLLMVFLLLLASLYLVVLVNEDMKGRILGGRELDRPPSPMGNSWRRYFPPSLS